MVRIVGSMNRSEFEADPGQAWRRARRLDSLLRAAAAPWPRGVTRATHAAMTLQDEARMLASARKVNPR